MCKCEYEWRLERRYQPMCLPHSKHVFQSTLLKGRCRSESHQYSNCTKIVWYVYGKMEKLMLSIWTWNWSLLHREKTWFILRSIKYIDELLTMSQLNTLAFFPLFNRHVFTAHCSNHHTPMGALALCAPHIRPAVSVLNAGLCLDVTVCAESWL